MTEENSNSAFVCPDCGKAIQRPTTELLQAVKVTCDHCGHEVSLDRRGPKGSEGGAQE
jgi:predicted RNA-binding Zn-ribbon protein involved in translation (DUF1610 family)